MELCGSSREQYRGLGKVFITLFYCVIICITICTYLHDACFCRDKLKNQQPNTGYRFDGEGYAIIDSSSYIKPETSDINLKFKTFAKEGLLFLAGNEDTFLSIEMRDGKVYLQVIYYFYCNNLLST